MIAVRWPPLAPLFALGCGPIAGASELDDTTSSGTTTTTTTTGAPPTTSSTTSAETGDGGWAACPSVHIDEPFAYRGYCLPRDGALPQAAGRLGIGGAPRFAFIGGTAGTPWFDQTTLVGWEGVQIAEERHDTFAYATSWFASVIDASPREALVGDALVDIVTIDGTDAGLEPAVKTTFSTSSRPPVVAIDLDRDGIDELVVGNLSGFGAPSLGAFRWNGAAWAWWDMLPPMLYGCPAVQARQIEYDGVDPPELAIVESCSGNDIVYLLVVTDEPLVFTVRLGSFRGGPITGWQIADFDADGKRDMMWEVAGVVPRRFELALAESEDLSAPLTIALDELPRFVDDESDCTTYTEPWIAVQADADGHAELMCGRTIVTSVLEDPVAVEAIAAGALGSDVAPHIVAHDVSGDGVDDLAMSGRDSAGEPRAFVLISGE